MTRLGFVRREILNDSRSFAAALLWSLLAVAAATVVRLALRPWVEGLPFLTFFPSVLVAALFLGWRWGAAVLLGSALTATLLFTGPTLSWSLGPQDVIGAIAFGFSAGLLVVTAEALRRSAKEVDNSFRREAALNMELQHRVKNSLAVVQGLALQTAKTAHEPEGFYEAFGGRLVALAEAHDVLSSGGWEECHLPELAQVALKAFAQREATVLGGPRCALPAASCVPLVLAIHELATNAIKYGALSGPSGRVSLTWRFNDPVVVLRWQEIGGPRVERPTRKGLGSRLLAKQPGLDAVSLNFAPDGVVCEIKINDARLAPMKAPGESFAHDNREPLRSDA